MKPKNADEGKRMMEAISGAVADKKPNRRRLLSNSDNWAIIWKIFTDYVETRKGTCSSEILNGVKVYDDGSFSYKCADSPALCNCIQHVACSREEQQFAVGNVVLVVFEYFGYTAYELWENGKYVAYGDVNTGEVNRRRRLLGNHNSGC